MKGRVVHVNENIEGAIYIGRRNNRKRLPKSPFANPFSVQNHGRHMACLMYRDYLRSSIQGAKAMRLLPDLRGKDLSCWCRFSNRPDSFQECHGDQILRLLEEHTDEELREWMT